MKSETKQKVLEYLVMINEGAKAIDKYMEIIENSKTITESAFAAIKQIKKNVIDSNFNNVLILIHKEEII